MSIKLTWQNDNVGADAVNIYRASAAFDRSELPVALTTLAGNATEFVDDTTTFNEVFFYRVGIVTGTEEAVGELKSFLDLPYTGPGPQTILRGQPHLLGYYGSLRQDEFIFSGQLMLAVGLDPLRIHSLQDGIDQQIWHKMVYKGKVLYIPEVAVAINGPSWEELYSKGLVYGDDTVGLAPVGEPRVQDARVTVKDATFAVRLFKGADTVFSEDAPPSGAVPDDTSEFSEIMYRLHRDTPLRESTVLSVKAATASGWGWVQDHTTNSDGTVSNNRVLRGIDENPNGSFFYDRVARTAATVTAQEWLPVLEYRPNE